MAVTAAAIAGGAGILGDIMSSSGASAANAANAQQAQLNRDFQKQQTLQVEGWEENLSDTAMQRRAADLKKANLNPLLAVGQGGASQPSVSPASGSMATMQNPNLAYSNLGAQVASAIQANQVQAQTDLTKAQTNKTISETPTSGDISEDGSTVTVDAGPNHKLGDATVAQINAQTDLTKGQKEQVAQNTRLIMSQVNNVDAQTALTNVQTAVAGQNLKVIEGTRDATVQVALAEAATAKNQMDISKGKYGPAIAFLNSILAPIHTAASAAGNFR